MVLFVVLIGLVSAHALAAYAGATPSAQCYGLAVQAMAVLAVLRLLRRASVADRMPWRLLCAVVGLPMLWTVCTLLALLLPHYGQAMQKLGLMASGASMIPALFLIARSFNRPQSRLIVLLDALLALTGAGLLFLLVDLALSTSNGAHAPEIMLIINHSDAMDLLLALMATLRLFGAGGYSRRHFYLCASIYFWVNGVVVALYNRTELHGLPWWAGLLIDLPCAALVLTTALPRGRWLRHARASLRSAELIAAFAPIVFSLAVLLLAISVARVSFFWGTAAAILAVMVYGVHMAFLHREHLEIQRLNRLSTQRLQQQVARDPLTGIANRVGLAARLRELNGSQDCSLLLIDIDFFKQFNDSHGHVDGDACLVDVATALAEAVPERCATVARYGGEEFVVVLPQTAADTAAVIARRLLATIQQLQIPHPASPLGVVTVSIGIATSQAGADVAIQLLCEADAALYRAKRNGRNCWVHAQDAVGSGSSTDVRIWLTAGGA